MNTSSQVSAIGEGLKLARVQRQLSTRKLAEVLGVSQSRVMQIERSGDNLEIPTIARVAKSLGYKVLVQLVPEDAAQEAISVPIPDLSEV